MLPQILLTAASDANLYAARYQMAISTDPALLWLLTLTDRGVLDSDQPMHRGSTEALLVSLMTDSSEAESSD